MAHSPLSRFLFAIYVLLLAYASLYPLSGWRDPGGSALAFLWSPWPRWVTPFDLAANALAYLPFGALCVLALRPRLRGWPAVLVAILSGAALSIALEAATAASNLVAVSLLASTLVRRATRLHLLLLGLVLAALAVRALASAILMRPEQAFAWFTPGAQLGLLFGTAVTLAAVSLPRVARLVLAAVLLMMATVLVNLSPPNPYTAAMLKVWEQGHFLNFNGLTRLVSAAWPFAALAYLMLLAARGAGAHPLR